MSKRKVYLCKGCIEDLHKYNPYIDDNGNVIPIEDLNIIKVSIKKCDNSKIGENKDASKELLKKQLANKEIDLSLARNEINTLTCNLKIAQEHDNIVCKQLFEKCKEISQDKISFCIEKLEKVKRDIEYFWKMVGYEGLDFNEVMGFIDNQIEELKRRNNE